MICPICSSEVDAESPIAELHDPMYHANDGQLYYYFCYNCEAIFHDEPITEEYYHNQYRMDVQGGKPGVLYKAIELQNERAKSLIPFLKRIKLDFDPKTAVDVGASTGVLVKTMNDLGIQANGVEIDKPYSEYAKKTYGYDYLLCLENVAHIYPELITIMHTLEHFLNPVQSLRTLRQASSDRAVMLCEVPNFSNSPLSMSYPHRFAYTERSLYNVLITSGWYPLWIVPFWGIHRNFVLPTNLLALCLSYPVSRFEYNMQSARLGQTMARKE